MEKTLDVANTFQCRSIGRGRGAAPPPQEFWQARLIWSEATLFTLLFGSMCSLSFISGFNKEKLLEIRLRYIYIVGSTVTYKFMFNKIRTGLG